MYSHLKISTLAHVAITIMITLNSTTSNFSQTNTTNATRAASASTDARTAMMVVAETVAGFLSETSDFQVVNDETTIAGSSVSTNNARMDSFSTNIIPAAAAASKPTTATTTTTTTTALKNSTMYISSVTHPNSTSETFSPVREKASPTTTMSPTTNIKNQTERETTINTKVTNNLPTNSTSTIISISNAATNSSLLDSLVNKVADLESTVYDNISHGAKSAGAENVGTLLSGSSFSRVDSLASKMQSLPSEVNTSSAGLGTVKDSSDAVQPDANNSVSKQASSSTSHSLSFWRRTSRLRRGQRADVEKSLRQTAENRGGKYDVGVGDDYSTAGGIAPMKIRTQRSISYRQSVTRLKTATLKPLTPGSFLSKGFNVERTKNSVESDVEKREQLNVLKNQKKENTQNYFKKDYKTAMNNRQKQSSIPPLSSDLINKTKFSDESAGNSTVPAMIETQNNALPWRGCRLCMRLNKQKKGRNVLRRQYHKKHKHHSRQIMAINPAKLEPIHSANKHQQYRDYNQTPQKNVLPAEVLRLTNNDPIPEVIVHRNGTIRKNKIFDFSQRVSPSLENAEKETDSERVKTKTDSVIPGVPASLIGREQTSSRNYTKTNSADNTNVEVSILSKQNIENHKLINTSPDIDKPIHTKIINDKNPNCNSNKLNPIARSKLFQSLKPRIFNSLEPVTRTSRKLMEERNQNRILNNGRSQDISTNSGFTFGKYTHDVSLEIGKTESNKDLNVGHGINNASSAKKLNASSEDKQNAGTRLMSFANGSESKVSFEENQMKKSNIKDRQFLLIENSSVEIRNRVNVGLQNAEELPVMHKNEKLRSVKISDSFRKEISFEDFKLTNKHVPEDTLKKLSSFNTDRQKIYAMQEASVEKRALNGDDTRDHFKSEDTKEIKNGYFDDDPGQRNIEKNDEGLTDNEDDDVTVVDEEDGDDGADEDSNVDSRKIFPEYKHDISVREDISLNLRNKENERKERYYMWLKNAYESLAYRQSHDFFLDPEFEKKHLERKVLRRWRNHHRFNWQQGLDASTQTEDMYLPLQNIHPHQNYPSTISNHEAPNSIQQGKIEDHQLNRIKRSPIRRTSNIQNIEYLNKFTESAIDEDNEKPCGNHGRHRSHVGGLHHLSRHQRRDIYQVTHVRHRRDLRFPPDTQKFAGDSFGKAAYFSGVRDLLKLRVKKRKGLSQELIPRQHFTIELWIKPEGGQSNPTVILGLFDMCHQDHKAKGWNIGIRTYEEGQEEDARIYFSLETDRANSPSILMSDRTYEPNRWVHVAASYTGKKMKLYINTALVGVLHLQTGDIFSVSASSCKEIFLGGMPYSKENLYRGSVDQILIWNFPLKHGDVVQNMFNARISMDKEKGIVFKESFNDLSQWKSFLKGEPELHFSNIEDYRYDLQLVAPPCGKTVCDDPDVIRSYVQHRELRQEKKVRYRIVNVMDDNEENPKVTKVQTVSQHRALVSAFKKYNISWELEEVKLRNTSLRHKTVLLDCLPMQIGDKHCNRECQHTQTGNDGGDCDPDEIPCDAVNLGNGRCDFECNRAYYEWDKGDCCQSAFKSANNTCLDPDSPNRIYLSMDEYKTALNVNGSTHLNVYLASWSLKGLATFPWEKNVYNVLGGTVVDTNSFGQPGKMDGLIHEFGHNLGLWHVHHGISEVKCDDPCMEDEPSLELGDLCSDTAPTAQNTHCRDPDWSVQACGISPFKNTPYSNYMSYASGNCTNHFTPQQVARMHCYLDLVYQPWQTTMKPSPVPLPPKVVAATLNSVTIVWLPGLGDNVYGSHSECHKCTQDGALIQYASSARAPSDSRKKLHWNKEEALGPPDAERCRASSLSWMQETYECISKCYIEFMFKYNTVPQRINIWVVWKAAVGIKNVKFYFIDGSSNSLGPIRAFCDMPFTANLNYTKKVKKVRIYPNNNYVGIDAIQLISTPESARICNSCRPTKYRVMRSPDFQRPVYTSDTMYIDKSVIRGVNYSYTIGVNIGNKVSGPSPALHYQHGQPFCGNGRVETHRGERCDDGNVNDGDGCTSNCEVEKFYRCKGTPSLCYRHDGDGICEEDEQNLSLRDCGYHTPEGYDDQWPISAIGNPRHQLTPKCSEKVLIGAPNRFQVCKNNVEIPDTWRPCSLNYFDAHDYWIKVYYARPVIAVGVVIYLGSDGRTYDSPEPKSLLVQLIDTDDTVTYVKHKLVASCQSNPMYVSILHDLSRPFFRTKGVKVSLSSSNIAIAGIRLRASQHFDPITPESCSQEQFYNPRSQQCVNQTCPRKFCDQLITENANTTCTGRGEGDICQVTCLDGYRIRNEIDEVICADGVWRRSKEVSCIPVDCRWPAMVHATFSCPNGTTFKQKCSFRCNPPAQLQGSGSMVTCEADRRWSMVNAYCLAFCHSPIEHANAYPTSRSCQMKKAHQAGSRCKFRCKKGYHIEGMPAKRRSLHLTCKESGEWEGNKCVRVTCKKIPPEFTGMYTCSESTFGGSRCTLKCPREARIQKIKCLQKGIWSSQFKMCSFPKSAMCPTPLLIDDRVRIRNCYNRSAGSTCEVTCNSQAYQPALPHMNGTIFDNKDRVMKLTCTGVLKWLPNPRHISCKGTCRVMSLKDGWCDSSNNRFFCDWDKGDCCASTVDGGKIRLDKPTCKSKCACKDPNAKENSNKSKK